MQCAVSGEGFPFAVVSVVSFVHSFAHQVRGPEGDGIFDKYVPCLRKGMTSRVSYISYKKDLTTSLGYYMNITEYVIVYCHFIHWHPTILGGKGETISTATHYQSPHIECTMYNFSTFINGRKP